MAFPLVTTVQDYAARGLEALKALRVPRFRDPVLAQLWRTPGYATTSGEDVSEETALSLSTLYRATTLLSDTLASAPWRVVVDQPTGGVLEERRSDAARALAELSFDSKELFVLGMLISGNGFAFRIPNDRGGAGFLKVVPPSQVAVEVDDEAQMRVYTWSRPDGRQFVFDEAATIHAPFRMSRNEWVGESPIATAAEAVGAALAARRFMADYFRDGFQPGVVLWRNARATGSPADMEATSQSAGDAYNARTRFRTFVIPKQLFDDMDEIPSGQSARDAEAVASASFFVREMARLYGIPLSWLAEGQDVNRSTASEETRQLAHSVKPHALRVGEAFGRVLLTREQRLQGARVDIDLTSLMIGTGEDQAVYWSKLVDSGLASVNEARNALSMPDQTGGDVLRAPREDMPLPDWLVAERREPVTARASVSVHSDAAAVASQASPVQLAFSGLLDDEPRKLRSRYGPPELARELTDG